MGAKGLIPGAAVLLALAGDPGDAKERNAPPPAAIAEIARCRALSDDAARLRCFDAAADQLASALATRKVYVLDRAEVQETRRSLFGLPVPADTVVGVTDDGNGVDHLDATVTAATQDPDGNWTVTLDNGTVWRQTDGYALAHAPRAGDKVLVKRAALGSFRLKVGTQQGVRARRIR